MTPTRRQFVLGGVRIIAGGATAAIVLPLLASCGRGDARRAPPLFEASFDVSPLTADGQTLVTATPGFDTAPILIERRSARDYVALSMMCTHEGCPVKPPVGGIIKCPCHGSQYDLDGKVLQGPAQFPLARYEVSYRSRSRRLTVRRDA
jgi:Rieske Fe-S protein